MADQDRPSGFGGGLPSGQIRGPAPAWLEPPWVARAIRLGWALVATLAARAVIDGARLLLSLWRVLG